ncbi:hypothetical protein HY950_01525 [Candidatus Gottesmanbacteria bacterium]|nr:hypothetical protein [Candidatus Gottesmanbacteria bacterium]
MIKKYRIFLFVLIFLAVFLSSGLTVSSAHAAKKRIRKTTSAVAVGSYSSARLSRPTNSIVITFLGLSSVRRVDYVLSYTANGIAQGVVGAFIPTGQSSDSRDLYFGTCSKGVCTPHYNIRNATLTVTTTITSGATNTKRYRIRI